MRRVVDPIRIGDITVRSVNRLTRVLEEVTQCNLPRISADWLRVYPHKNHGDPDGYGLAQRPAYRNGRHSDGYALKAQTEHMTIAAVTHQSMIGGTLPRILDRDYRLVEAHGRPISTARTFSGNVER